jgi:uncharacterized surface protein with fasciclin (FAS1) repeats
MNKFSKVCLQPALMAWILATICIRVNAADNIVEVAEKAGSFKTLLAAANAAGLVEALQGGGPFTVFAPTDDAFAKLSHGTVEALLKPENQEKLATILKYHVVSARVAAKDAVQVESAQTLSGDDVSISIRDGRLAVNQSNVIVNDVEASNGIIHVIDTVLLPPEKPSNFEADSDVELLQRIDPKFESSLRSKNGAKQVAISFCNLSARPIQVYWIRFNGEKDPWRRPIAPGKVEVCEKTYQNHVWLIADESGATLDLYVVGQKDAIIVNTH